MLDSKGILENLAEQHGFALSFNILESRVLLENDKTPVTINFDLLDNNTVAIYFFVRTTSWDLAGERTDANEIMSVLLSAFLRFYSCASCRLLDIQHPVEVPETEVYARFILLDQPRSSSYQLDERGIEQVSKLLSVTNYFGHILPYLFDWDVSGNLDPAADENYSFEDAEHWAKDVAEAIGEPFNDDAIQYMRRVNPSWLHYRSINTGITVYKSSGLAQALSSAVEKLQPWDGLTGVNGTLYLSGNIGNSISFKDSNLATKILARLNNGESFGGPTFIPLENYLIASSGSYVLFLNRECDRRSYEEERNIVRDRHQKESFLLFPVTSFVWSDSINPSKFELFILALLNLEDGVVWARQVSSTNEPDGGRDLICEWNTPRTRYEFLNENESPFTTKRVIVQCKAYRNPVDKSKVQDIRDYVEHHNSQGFFLAVSSSLTRGLTEQLEKLRRDGKVWVDWWTRVEIEERLQKHPELAEKFSDIVQVKR